MAQSLVFRIAAELEKGGFTEAAGQVRNLEGQTKGLKTQTTGAAQGVDLLKTAYAALAASGIISFYTNAINEAAQASEEELRLSNRVNQTGTSYSTAKPKLDAYLDSLQRLSGVSGGELSRSLDGMIEKTGSVRAAQEGLVLALGLTRAGMGTVAQTGDMVAGVINGDARAMMQMGRELGLTSSQAKDQSLVLKTLRDRYAELGIQLDPNTKKLKEAANAFKEINEQIGKGLAGPIAGGARALMLFTFAATAFVEAFGLLMGQLPIRFAIAWQAIKDIATKGWSEANRIAQEQTAIQDKIFKDALTQIGEHYRKILGTSGGNIEDQLVDPAIRAAAKMTLEMQRILAEGAAAMATTDEERLRRRGEILEIEKQQQLEALQQMQDFSRLSAEDRAALEIAIEQRRIGAMRRLYEDDLRARTQIYFSAAQQVGRATALMLRGEQDAWKDASKNIIDMIVQQSIAVVQARSIAAAAGRLAISGGTDYAGAAAAIGWGLAQSVAIAAIGEGAKAAIGGSGGAISAGSGGSGGGGSYAQPMGAAEAPTAPQRQQITVIVQGDVVDSDTFLDGLASRLSDRVENADVRLVATSTQTGG